MGGIAEWSSGSWCWGKRVEATGTPYPVTPGWAHGGLDASAPPG
ncbi:hypothetical protein [Streptomyces sp. NPDC018693]